MIDSPVPSAKWGCCSYVQGDRAYSEQSEHVECAQKGRTTMYARVLTAQAKPGQTDELIRIINDSVIPAVKREIGFKGLLLLNEHATRKGISITLWETPVDLKASQTSAYLQQQLDKVAPLLAEPPVVGVYEVSIQV